MRNIKHFALALTLGAGLGLNPAAAQTVVDVGGAGTIGTTTLTTPKIPAGGSWTVAGGDGFKNSDLISPPVTVPATGPVTLRFSHRYFFEAEWDGGAVFVIVNGAPAAYLPATSFSANGYSGDVFDPQGAWPTGQGVFYNKSADYDTPGFIESVANLGTLNLGDTVSVQFRGRWDGGYLEPAPNWDMMSVKITTTTATLLDTNFVVDGASNFTVITDAGVPGPWTYLTGLSKFEIDADTLAADRYAPSAPGTNINLNGANISVELLTGTLRANSTFTLFNLAGGTTLSGTPGTISLPPGSWNTSNLAINGTITLVLPVMPSPPVPVTNGLQVWLAADKVNPSDPAQVDASGKVELWQDATANGYNASNPTATQRPTYIANGLNGKPVLRFTQANSSKLLLGDLSASFGANLPPPVDTTPISVNSGTGGAALNGNYEGIPTRGVTGALVGDSDLATSFVSPQAMTIPFSPLLNPSGAFTAEIWAKPNGSATTAVMSSGDFGPTRTGWIIYAINANWDIRLFTNSGTTFAGFTTPLTLNAWQHLALVHDGLGGFQLYVNGAAVTPILGATPNGTAAGTVFTPNPALPYVAASTGFTAVAARWAGTAFANYFDGTADEFALYSSALSGARILAHYENGMNAPTPRPVSYSAAVLADAPVGYYRLNEPASTSAVASASMFAVAVPNNDGRYNLFGNRANDDRWVANTWTESSPGSFRGSRAAFAAAGYNLWPQSGAHVYAVESSAALYRFVIDGNANPTLRTAGNYNSGAGANWTIGDSAANNDQRFDGDFAEILLYDRVLTPAEAALVGGYLTQKYALPASYPPATLAATATVPLNGLGYPSGTPLVATVNVVEVGTAPFTVEFWLDGVLAGTDTTSPYSLNLGVLSVGNHTFYAKVTNSSAPATTAFSTVSIFSIAPQTTTTTTLASSVNPSIYGAGTMTATVVAANSTPLTGGAVQFFDGATPIGSPVAVDFATGQATYNINTLGVGTRNITATYSGFGVYLTSSSSAISQVVNQAPLTFTATDQFRPTAIANPNPFPYTITGFRNGHTTLATAGVTGLPSLTTTAVTASPAGSYPISVAVGTLASANYSFTLVNGILTVAEVPDTFSINFFVGPEWPYGGLGEIGNDAAKAALKIDPGMAAGFGDWFTSAWLNYLVPWAPATSQTAVNVTSNRASAAKFRLIDCRNGWTYTGAPRTSLVSGGNWNMMDAHVNGTLDPDAGATNAFRMEMTEIPFPLYDVIFYIGSNVAQFGDGMGAILFNGGAERDFTLAPGAFNGTFTETVDATTPGNYIVYKGVTGSSFSTVIYGKGPNGFNHLGPFGFQIRAAQTDYEKWSNTYPGAVLSDPNADLDGDGWSNDKERLFGLNPTSAASTNPFTAPVNATAGTLSFTRRDNALTGKFTDIETSTDLQLWTVDTGAVLTEAAPDVNGVELVSVTLSPGLLTAPKLFVRVCQRDALVPLAVNFETGNGGFTVLTELGSPWAWGDPDSVGIGGSITQGNGGSLNCWGTDISNPGYYIRPTLSRLRSAVIDLTNVDAAELTFAEALDLDAGDSAVVNIIEATTNTVISSAIYTARDANGTAATWGVANSGTPIRLPAAAIGRSIRIEWLLNGQGTDYAGWYIDDVTVREIAP